jgi:hypothetical protein
MAAGRYHWSNVSPEARFWIVNASAFVPWLVLLLFPSIRHVIYATVMTGLLLYIEYVKKMKVFTFLRAVGVWLTGRVLSTFNNVKKSRVR